MSTPLDEEFQRFTFDERWIVFKYDSAETGYFAIKDAVEATKACDFLGVFADTVAYSVAYFMEIKDFRGFRIQNKKRLGQGELAMEVAQKVRDTLAGIVSGCRRGDSAYNWHELGEYLTSPNRELVIVLCLEDDALQDKAKLGVQAELIRQKLSWLRPKVRVVSQGINPHKLPGVVVRNLPGACGHAR
jgi:hypothetical protein